MDARDWDDAYSKKPLVWGAEPNRLFASLVGDLTPGRALDLAAGEGRNAVWLAERGWSVTAVDFSPVALERARRMASERGVEVELIEADVLAYRPEPGSFDLVSLLYLQLRHEDMVSVLERAAASVAPGGTLVVIAHDLSNLESGVGGPQDPSVLTTPELVSGALGDLAVERSEVVARTVPDEDVPALDTLVVAHRPTR